jgi:hypothetical protein
VIQRLVGIELLLADDHVGNRLLVMLRDGLGYSPDLCRDQEGLLERHRVVGNVHFMVLDGELDLWSHEIGVLVDGKLVDGRVVFLLFLLSLLLLFLGSHAPTLNIYYAVALSVPAFPTPELQSRN